MRPGKRILIADDDESLVDVMARRFESFGLRVDRAYDGISTLHQINEREPDLIILDVNMPAGSGLGVCKMLSRDLSLRSIPIVILTGRKDQETIRTCRELHAHYVAKGPDVWSTLEPLVLDLLGLAWPGRTNSGKARAESSRQGEAGQPVASHASSANRKPSPPAIDER